MNKKFNLSLAITSLLLGSAHAGTIYDKDGTSLDAFGKIDVMALSDSASRSIKSATSKKSNDATIQNAVHFGIAGRTKINNSLYAIAFSEWLMPTGNNGVDSIKTRAQYVGLDAQQYGTLTFGRGDNAFYTVAGVTDIFNQLDSNVNDHYAFGDYQPALAMYSLSSMGWDFRISYQTAADNVNDTDISIHNGAAFSFATRLDNGIGIAYGMSYYYLKHDDNHQIANYYQGQTQKMYPFANNDFFVQGLRPTWKTDKGISVSYGTFGDGLYAALNFTQTKYNKFTHYLYSYEAVVNYAFDNGFALTSGFGIKRFNGANVIEDLTIGAYYNFTPNFKVFVEACFDISSKPENYYTKNQIKAMNLARNKALIGAEYAY